MSAAPLELAERYVGENVWIVMKNDEEFSGKLLGFDSFMNIVLEGATAHSAASAPRSLPKVLLHGRNVAMILPGGIQAPGIPSGLETFA